MVLRPAAPTDRSAVAALLAATWRRHGSQSLEDQAALLANGASAVAWAGAEAVGFLGVDVRVPTIEPVERWADVQLAALEAGRRGDGLLAPLVETALPALYRAGCTGLVALVAPGWLADGLQRAGLRAEDDVITYVRGDRWLPASVGEPAHLRLASAQDADLILDLNARAFEPLWRYDDAVVLSWLIAADHAIIAEVEGRPAGFALTTAGHAGSYAHLIRVATHPACRGRGVGRQLVADAVRYARESDAPGLALNTQASNTVSRSLYDSLGFHTTGHALNVYTLRLLAA